MEQKNPIQVSERIFAVIETLAKLGPTGLLDLSKELDLNKTTVHRILNSLICMNYVRQDSQTLKYSLTFKFCGIANQILAQNNIIDLTHPYIKELSDQTGETVHMVKREGREAIYIDKVEPTLNSVRLVSMVGKTIPLYCSGVGKAMLADLSDEQIAAIWRTSRICQLTEHTVTDYGDFCELIREIRRNGYSLDNEENELGVRCIAVSIKDPEGEPTYALSISAPKDRMPDTRIQELYPLILKTKEKIQKEILYQL